MTATELMWGVLRPVLRMRLAWFRHLVRGGTFPPAPSTGDLQVAADARADPSADRVGWLGSPAAARFGVLHDDLTALSRVAALVEAHRGRPLVWIEAGAALLTVRDAAEDAPAALGDVDAVVVAFGYSDVLLMTSVAAWTRDLDRLLDRARRPGHVLSPVIVGGIPPMDRFTETAWMGRGMIRAQAGRLDAATADLVQSRGDCVFVPFPDLDAGAAQVRGRLWSWSRVHQLWAAALAPELARLLDEDA
jgi:lysophospholipase L1-like esterase